MWCDLSDFCQSNLLHTVQAQSWASGSVRFLSPLLVGNAKDSLQLAEPFHSKRKVKMGKYQASTVSRRGIWGLGVGKNMWGLRTLMSHIKHKGIVDTSHNPDPKARRRPQHTPCAGWICSELGFAWDCFHTHPPDFSSNPLVLASSAAS